MQFPILLPRLLGIASVALALGSCTAGEGTLTGPPPAVPVDVAPTATATATPAPITLNVFAAASLTDAFNEIGDGFAAEHAGVTPEFNFAGSQQLAAQIHDGAPADVFAAANMAQMDAVVGNGAVVSGTARTFAGNSLVVAYPLDNPGRLQTLSDLARPNVKLVIAAKSVPIGDYTLEFLRKASAHPDFTPSFSATVLANVVSFEDDVKGILGKVAQGEADAGIVYSSDGSGAMGARVITVAIPDDLNVIAAYPIAPLAHSQHPDLAQAFVDYMLSPAGQAVLVKHGFLPATAAP